MYSLSKLPRTLSRLHLRQLSTTPSLSTSWSPSPSPPRLPKEDQEVFEKLQQQSTGAFSTPRPDPTPSATPSLSDLRARINQADAPVAKVEAKGDGGELHPHVRRGAKPEFEGEVNPKTGEVGGPKNEPLRWGDTGDWSYNGRVTDF